MKTTIEHIRHTITAISYCLLVLVIAACSGTDDPYFTAGPDDQPRILNTDIPEGENGEPGVIASIERTTNFTFDLIVTPAQYSTVAWFIDDVQVAEGLSIDVPVKTGEHILQIVVTTTKGLTTSRTCKLVVRPAATDPVPGDNIRERLVVPGTAATLHGTNMAAVVKVIIGGQQAAATYNAADDCVEYTVPDMAEGIYDLEVADAEGNVFAAGKIELNNNPEYPAEGGEQTVWEGAFSVTWGTPFNELQTTLVDMVEPGDILRVYVSGEGQGCAATAWWRNLVTGFSDDDEGRGDTPISGDMVLEYTISELSIQLLQEQDGFFMVGDGYTVKKITVE